MFYQFRLSETDSGLDFDIDLEPDRRLYCFVGENAVGKTALLESWAQVVWWRHVMWSGVRKSEKSRSFAGYLQVRSIRDGLKDLPSLRVPGVRLSGHDLKAGDKWSFIQITSDASVGLRGDPLVDRPIVFVPADRRATVVNIGPEALSFVGGHGSNFVKAIRRGVDATHRRSLDVAELATWLTSRLLVNPAFVVGLRTPIEEVVALFQLMERFDPVAFKGLYKLDAGAHRLNVAYAQGQVLFMGRPLDRLASGWTALLKIFQEIVSSVAAWELARDSSDILGTDALIFIDEIDAHLHPKWQVRLLPFLKEMFPNATFVVTTHSPLVLRDTEPGEGYELVRTDHQVTARRLGSPRDWYLSDVLSDAFHVDVPLPGSEGSSQGPALDEVLLTFARKTQEFAQSQAEEARVEAMTLYGQIRARLPNDDPRARVVEQLRQLLP